MSNSYQHWVDRSRGGRDQPFYEVPRQHHEGHMPSRTQQLGEPHHEGYRYYPDNSYSCPKKRKMEDSHPAAVPHIPTSSSYSVASSRTDSHRYHDAAAFDNGYTPSNSYDRSQRHYQGSEPHSNYPPYHGEPPRVNRGDTVIYGDHPSSSSYQGYDDRTIPTSNQSHHTTPHPYENTRDHASYPPYDYQQHSTMKNSSMMQMVPEPSSSRDYTYGRQPYNHQLSRSVSYANDHHAPSRYDHSGRDAAASRETAYPYHTESRDDYTSSDIRVCQESRDDRSDPASFYGPTTSATTSSQYQMRSTIDERPSVVQSNVHYVTTRDGSNVAYEEQRQSVPSDYDHASSRYKSKRKLSPTSEQRYEEMHRRQVSLDVYPDRHESNRYNNTSTTTRMNRETAYGRRLQKSEPTTDLTPSLPPVVSFSSTSPPTTTETVEGSNTSDGPDNTTKVDTKMLLPKKIKRFKKVDPSKPFESYLEDLKAFKEKFGHQKTSKCGDKYKTLNHWCTRIRRWNNLKEQGKLAEELLETDPMLTESQLEQLNELDFDWGKPSPRKTNFDKQFEKLMEYKKEHGHCNVTAECRGYAALSMYCDSIRKTYRRLQKDGHVPQSYNKLTQENIDKLQNIGFSWESTAKQRKNERFEEHINLLKTFKQEHGHCNVPRSNNMMEYYSLAQWCNGVRNTYKLGKLAPEKVMELEKVGFQWDINATKRNNKKALSQDPPTDSPVEKSSQSVQNR